MAVRRGTGGKAPEKNASGTGRGTLSRPDARSGGAALPSAAGRGRKKPAGGGVSRASWAILFWAAFAVFISGLFLFNREAINTSIRNIKDGMAAGETAVHEDPAPLPPGPVPPPVPSPDPGDARPPDRTAPQILPPEPPAQGQPAEQPVSPPAGPAPGVPAERSGPSPAPARQSPAVLPAAGNAAGGGQNPPSRPAAPAETRERTLYFIQVDRGGTILRVKVTRRLPLSDSPLTGAIQALIAGPGSGEKSKGFISLIPPDTRILSATVRGGTAYVSFSEDFQYNSYGVEGYAGQIRQVVFTATEFPNVKDVQILIEGRRVDYLGEGVWIGSPLSRESL